MMPVSLTEPIDFQSDASRTILVWIVILLLCLLWAILVYPEQESEQ